MADKTALVTGASAGIGQGIAVALAAEGIRLAIAGRRSDALAETAERIVAVGSEPSLQIIKDLLDDDSADMLASKSLAELGSVDILINNAGGNRPFELHTDESIWQEIMTLNFTRPRQLADRLIDQMADRGWGRIVNMSGKSEPEGISGTFSAKAALHSWAKGLSRTVGPKGITVNCIPPGRIMSDQIRRHYTPEYRKWQAENEIPMRRYGEPVDVAALVTFICSPLADYITGTVIPVDGGLRRYQF